MDIIFKWLENLCGPWADSTFVLSLCISIFAIVMACVYRSKERWLIALAMVVCTVGDVFMTNYMGIRSVLPINNFYFGVIAFMIGHIIYAISFILMIKKSKYKYFNKGFFIALGLVIAIIIAVLIIMLVKNIFDITLFIICFVYASVIGFNCVSCTSFAVSAKNWKIIGAIGVFLFFISDIFIGLDVLCGIGELNSLLTWWFYPIGQILLIASAQVNNEDIKQS